MSRLSSLELRVEMSVAALGPDWDMLFAGATGLQTGREWLAASAEAALPPGAEARFVTVIDAAGPLALFPMVAGPGDRWGSLTTPYTCLYQPLLRLNAPAEARAAATAFAHYCRSWPVTRLEALDPDWHGLPTLRAAFAAAGMPTRSYAHFANWFETVPAASWDAYLQSRTGALRETIRRKMRAVERAGDIRIEVARSRSALLAALDAYEAVYARSWKEPEPFPAFNAAIAQALAQTDALRIIVMWRAATAVAAQYWTIVGGCATVLKLAHDEAFKALSPGTVLTASAIKHLIETEGAVELDFGRGDDPYKRAWAGTRRQRIGLIGINPTTPTGLQTLVKHDVGRLLRVAQMCWTKMRLLRAGHRLHRLTASG